MATEKIVQSAADRLAALDAKFGKEAVTYFLDSDGDYFVGVVQAAGNMTTKHGVSPYVEFLFEEGSSLNTVSDSGPLEKDKRYRYAFLGTVAKGQFDRELHVVGARLLVMNRGERENRAKDQMYRNIETRVL